jgi:S-adenosylmethionine:tRNA ribosyltransferase-isomerase
MPVSDYFYELPDELIAQQPLERRDNSRMLVASRLFNKFIDSHFERFPEMLEEGDILVLNNTRVFPARLFGVTDTGARVEIFLVEDRSNGQWEALARPAKRLKKGRGIKFDERFVATVEEVLDGGHAVLSCWTDGDFYEELEKLGRTPLPPYIKREREANDCDRERYQTVYARNRGAIAAPTAGLHFTPEVLDRIRERGVEIAEITLHVGYGTFEPIRAEDLSEHRVLPERFEISNESADSLNEARESGGRVIAVGTTTTRALESNVSKHGKFTAECGMADLTILPGYEFKAIDGLLTNFHLPKSSLLVLVSTFGGHELIMEAYKHAVAERYRFYSYGDCMFIS